MYNKKPNIMTYPSNTPRKELKIGDKVLSPKWYNEMLDLEDGNYELVESIKVTKTGRISINNQIARLGHLPLWDE